MRLTRRGGGVVVVAAAGFALAGLFGARAINAVVLPAAVAMAAAYLQLRTFPVPDLARDLPPDDFVGETATVELRFEGVSRPFAGRVTDELSEGLSGDAAGDVAVGGDPFVYEVTYERRGVHTLGPATVVGRDVFGLLERELRVPNTDELLAYPTVYRLGRAAQHELLGLRETERSEERDEFDRLREYDRGDALRNVNWKASAKRDELVVTEFAAAADVSAVTVAASASAEGADRMAEAAASVTLALLDVDVPVRLVLPTETVEVESGVTGRRRLLEACALTTAGSAADADADIVLRATGDGVTVAVDGLEHDFDGLRVGSGPRSRPIAEDGSRPDDHEEVAV
ncbi:DUF58 domain-containing protein [Halobium salinum]|uniref:DUF58 domain-containing protein n=1 Tax=Halobium salinum TaxID=1364940 RepID=A0ABD5PC08_9EURY|nr:DUF58 domain-containing protein [Halobium salinum]